MGALCPYAQGSVAPSSRTLSLVEEDPKHLSTLLLASS